MELEPFVGARCFTTEALGVTLLGLYCLTQAALLGTFMKLDAGFEHPDEDTHHRTCTSMPMCLYNRRFSLTVLPTVLFPIVGIVLMWTSLSMNGCLFQSGPYMTFVLCFVWAALCLLGARKYEKERSEYVAKLPEFRSVLLDSVAKSTDNDNLDVDVDDVVFK